MCFRGVVCGERGGGVGPFEGTSAQPEVPGRLVWLRLVPCSLLLQLRGAAKFSSTLDSQRRSKGHCCRRRLSSRGEALSHDVVDRKDRRSRV